MPPDPVSPREIAEEIKPCPWCGGPCFILREKVDPRESPYVFCDSEQCGASGPCDLDPEKGVRSWNRVASREERIRDLEGEVSMWKQAKESGDSICLSLSRALGADASLRALGLDPERIRVAEQEVRDGRTVDWEVLRKELLDAAARRAMERG